MSGQHTQEQAQRPLGMSMFASRQDYCKAVEAQEGYDPEDAHNDGDGARHDGSGKNPYSQSTQPICYAAWSRGFNGKSASTANARVVG